MNRIIINIIIFSMLSISGDVLSESIEEIDKRAEEYYKNKDFNKAISEWLTILEIDPRNEEIQKK